VLVGLTFNEPDGPQLDQFFGTVMSTDPDEGITLRLEGSRSGEVYTLPPDLRAFFPAAPGSYRLRDTGEVVEDPDYTTTWERTPPGKPTFRIALGRRLHLSGWPAMLLAPVFIPIILLLRLAKSMFGLKSTEDLTPEDVERYLQEFLEGSGGDWDWDDFTSIPLTDPELDRIREEALYMEPPLSEEDRLRLVELLAHVRTMKA
jgi:hypothetical protein